jgi:hypothetical protein
MALQTSGAISLSNIQTEFGGSNPISLSEYYSAAGGVPASGAISLSDFYGTSNGIMESGYLYVEGNTYLAPLVGGTFPTTASDYISVFLPNNGPTDNNTLNSAYKTEIDGSGEVFAPQWPADSSAYAGWDVGCNITTPDVDAPYQDFIHIYLYDRPTWNLTYTPSTPSQLFYESASVSTDQALWTTATLTIKGSTSNVTSSISVSRANGTFLLGDGATINGTASLRQPPFHKWTFNFGTSNTTTYLASPLMTSMTPTLSSAGFTAGEVLTLKIKLT